MLLPLVIASGAILGALNVTVYGTDYCARLAPDIYIVKLLASVIAGYALSTACAAIYRASMSLGKIALMIDDKPNTFAVSAIFVLAGLIYTQGQLKFSPRPNEFTLIVVVVYVAVIAFLGFEGGRLFPSVRSGIDRFFFGIFLGAIPLCLTLTFLFVAINVAAHNMNEVYASAVASWAGTLAATAGRCLRIRDVLIKKSLSKSIEAMVKRDIPTVVATVLAFVFFKATGAPPIIFSIVVGAIAGILGLWLVFATEV